MPDTRPYNTDMMKHKAEELIIYMDASILVVRKPAGLAVETKRATEVDLESLLRSYLTQKGEASELHIIQRLDQPVEGLLAFARNKKAAADLTRQLGSGSIQKNYRALVEGPVPAKEGLLTDWLQRDPKTNSSQVVEQPAKSQAAKGRFVPKKAELSYRKIAEREVEIALKTGRHHQIRVQLAHAGMPIKGDRKYGAKSGGPLCLCSCRLTLLHPDTRKRMGWSIVPSFEGK